jgi:hypothetical protein
MQFVHLLGHLIFALELFLLLDGTLMLRLMDNVRGIILRIHDLGDALFAMRLLREHVPLLIKMLLRVVFRRRCHVITQMNFGIRSSIQILLYNGAT